MPMSQACQSLQAMEDGTLPALLRPMSSIPKFFLNLLKCGCPVYYPQPTLFLRPPGSLLYAV